ncbi:MAG: hypothetical protein AVDCRST_MAG64-629, partial [uncultured Phycisphaerae bacterium]
EIACSAPHCDPCRPGELADQFRWRVQRRAAQPARRAAVPRADDALQNRRPAAPRPPPVRPHAPAVPDGRGLPRHHLHGPGGLPRRRPRAHHGRPGPLLHARVTAGNVWRQGQVRPARPEPLRLSRRDPLPRRLGGAARGRARGARGRVVAAGRAAAGVFDGDLARADHLVRLPQRAVRGRAAVVVPARRRHVPRDRPARRRAGRPRRRPDVRRVRRRRRGDRGARRRDGGARGGGARLYGRGGARRRGRLVVRRAAPEAAARRRALQRFRAPVARAGAGLRTGAGPRPGGAGAVPAAATRRRARPRPVGVLRRRDRPQHRRGRAHAPPASRLARAVRRRGTRADPAARGGRADEADDRLSRRGAVAHNHPGRAARDQV